MVPTIARPPPTSVRVAAPAAIFALTDIEILLGLLAKRPMTVAGVGDRSPGTIQSLGVTGGCPEADRLGSGSRPRFRSRGARMRGPELIQPGCADGDL